LDDAGEWKGECRDKEGILWVSQLA
jgi:hypothetical protein